MKAWIFMKFETYTHKIVLYHQRGECARGVNRRVSVLSQLCTYTPHARVQIGELVINYDVMNISLKFHKDPSFC